MLAAALIRNIAEYTNFTTIHMGEINDLGGISLSLFLGMAMITLKLWELASLALPLVILLAAQTLLIGVFTYFVIFRIMGHDYDAAVLAAGTCGFGMGATPNAMANMQALCDRFVPSVKAYLLIHWWEVCLPILSTVWLLHFLSTLYKEVYLCFLKRKNYITINNPQEK